MSRLDWEKAHRAELSRRRTDDLPVIGSRTPVERPEPRTPQPVGRKAGPFDWDRRNQHRKAART